MAPARGHGWIPDFPDHRDLLFSAHPAASAEIPPSSFLMCPPAFDQKSIGSCTANSAGMGVSILGIAENHMTIVISRLQQYYESRKLLGAQYVGIDSGAMIRDAIKVLGSGLIGPESLWPYDVSMFTSKPPQDVYDAGVAHALTYHRVVGAAEARAAIAAGAPVNFGFTVRDGQLEEADSTGALTPHIGAKPVGGHAVLAVGYDDARAALLVRNSWGKDFGTSIPGQEALGKGNFWAPYSWFDGADVDDRWAMVNWKE